MLFIVHMLLVIFSVFTYVIIYNNQKLNNCMKTKLFRGKTITIRYYKVQFSVELCSA